MRRRRMPKRYAKYGLFLFSRDYLVVYIYIYIYTYVNFKAINNAFDAKMQKHIFSLKYFLQKLHQFNKNLSKHQAKINTAINTN